jgi:hypothetical protein
LIILKQFDKWKNEQWQVVALGKDRGPMSQSRQSSL